MDPAMPDINVSDVVVSVAGRDQGEWFYVVAQDQTYLFLANGKDRTLEKPKRKKKMHVQPTTYIVESVAEKLQQGGYVLDAEIKKALKKYQ